MIKPFDATTRNLIEIAPADWLAFLGIPVSDPSRVTVIDSNLSTVTADADKVLWIEEPAPWIEHIELQVGRDTGLAERMQLYSTLLRARHAVPVRTLLLRPAADGPELTGVLEQKLHNGDVYHSFRYDIIRVWQQPVDVLLTCGLTVLPLAPVADVSVDEVPGVLLAISERLEKETNRADAATLWNATRILMGLRYPREKVDSLCEGVSAMLFGIRGIEESSVYQGILEKGEALGMQKGLEKGLEKGIGAGRIERTRQILLRQGRKKFGPPSERVEAEIAALADLERFDELFDRVLEVSTWDELLPPDNHAVVK
jgi:predicted transposase YdaD